LLKNQSVSGFIARRVSAYMDQVQNLTVPELKQLALRHQLDGTGNKVQLRTRFSVWVRNEVAKGTVDLGIAHPTDSVDEGKANLIELEDATDDDTSTSEDELELTGNKLNNFQFLRTVPNESPSTHDLQSSIADAAVDLNDASEDENVSNFRDPSTPSIHTTLKIVFGFDRLRDGQEWAIRRCLNQQRSLLVAPTGFGKSLCYALPAAMMDGVCIVVSPLLSLIQDQIRMTPARLAAVTLSGHMSTAATASTLDDIVRGRIKLLFVSPERLTSASFRRLFRRTWNTETKQYVRYFPEVSLLCVDEAHCMSQWAHNFRPAYLRLRSIVDIIEPQSVLAITATAGPRVIDDICRTLRIENADDSSSRSLDEPRTSCGVRVSSTNRDNIDVKCLFLDSQEERLSTVRLLDNVKSDKYFLCSSSPFSFDQLLTILGHDKKFSKPSLPQCLAGCLTEGSVIVYTWRQQDAEVVAENIQSSDLTGGVVVYHGGMDATARAKAQSKFMRGKARICVATIAFGLGINKADIAGVIHLYMSSSPEHYIQEIGRAGRDGRAAQAISLILNDEVFIRHSLAYSDMFSRSQVKALLSILVQHVEASLLLLKRDEPTTFPVNVSFPQAMSILGCDCKVETVETILSLLEERNGKEPLLFIQGTSYDSATVAPRRCILDDLAQKEPIARAIIQCSDFVEPPAGQVVMKDDSTSFRRKSNLTYNTFGSYSFSIAKCSNCLGDCAEPRHVFAALRRLESDGDIDFALSTAPKDRILSLRLTSEGMKYFGNGNQHLMESLVDETADRFVSTISTCSNKVLDIHYIMRTVFEASLSEKDYFPCKKSASLSQFQQLIEAYFKAEGSGSMLAAEAPDLPNFIAVASVRELSADVEVVLSYLSDIQGGTSGMRLVHLADSTSMDYTVLLITKFLHGLAPPSIPLQSIRNNHLFGKMQGMQFSKLHEAVGRLLVSKGDAANKLLH
jgi:ATP-dependent DNA helicase Q4